MIVLNSITRANTASELICASSNLVLRWLAKAFKEHFKLILIISVCGFVRQFRGSQIAVLTSLLQKISASHSVGDNELMPLVTPFMDDLASAKYIGIYQ